jgi:hypothetical protein
MQDVPINQTFWANKLGFALQITESSAYRLYVLEIGLESQNIVTTNEVILDGLLCPYHNERSLHEMLVHGRQLDQHSEASYVR